MKFDKDRYQSFGKNYFRYLVTPFTSKNEYYQDYREKYLGL